MIEVRVCPRENCGLALPATTEFFYVRQRKPDGTVRLDGWCKDCRKKSRMDVYWRNPEKRRDELRQARQLRREKDPEFVARERGYQQAYRQRIREDPEAARTLRQSKRIQARLAAERRGVTFSNRIKPEDVREEERRSRRLPGQEDAMYVDPAPLRSFLNTIVREADNGWTGLSEMIGLDESSLRKLAEGTSGESVHEYKADLIFTRAGRPDLYAVHYG